MQDFYNDENISWREWALQRDGKQSVLPLLGWYSFKGVMWHSL
jgi:hypothetical protein